MIKSHSPSLLLNSNRAQSVAFRKPLIFNIIFIQEVCKIQGYIEKRPFKKQSATVYRICDKQLLILLSFIFYVLSV